VTSYQKKSCIIFNASKCKGKDLPVQVWTLVEAPGVPRKSASKGVKFVSLNHRPPLTPPGNILLEAESTRGL
jgi:hypothetical protein